MIARIGTVGALLLALISVLIRPQAGHAAARVSDLALLRAASVRAGHSAPALVVRWLRSQRGIGAAAVGPDGRTVEMRFSDGQEAAVLARTMQTVPLSGALLRRTMRPLLAPRFPGAPRAAVWEPFATELGLGSAAGAPEVAALQGAGFAVSQAYDSAVTVGLLSTMAQYNVVYMHTHSGVTAGGDGIVATGELAYGGDPFVPNDGSVIPIGVAGSNDTYYGINSGFIRAHVGQFPQNSILFLNGCKLLPAQTFWNALSAQGAGVLVSWTEDATAGDDFLSGAAFFNVMANGSTSVGDALGQLHAANLGISRYQGVTATLGSSGNSGITLRDAAAGQPAATATPVPLPPTSTPLPTATSTETPIPTRTATPRPTRTPTATLTPTATRTPTATATPTPVPIPLTATLNGEVGPGKRQTVTVGFVPDTTVDVQVTYPDGTVRQGEVATDGHGTAQYDYVQPGSTVTKASQTATVTLSGTEAGVPYRQTYAYTVKFGKIDVTVSPPNAAIGSTVHILVHSAAHTVVTVTVAFGKGRTWTSQHHTGAHGWASVPLILTRQRIGSAHVATVHASAVRKGNTVSTSTRLTIS